MHFCPSPLERSRGEVIYKASSLYSASVASHTGTFVLTSTKKKSHSARKLKMSESKPLYTLMERGWGEVMPLLF